MNRNHFSLSGRAAVLSLLIGLSPVSRADRVPDPIELFAGLVAFSELCAVRFSNMGDATTKLLRDLARECREHSTSKAESSGCELGLPQLHAMPGFTEALENARAQIKSLPAEDVAIQCEAMHSK